MNRTQKKCFTLSVLAHGMMLAAILCFAAFRPAPVMDSSDEILVIPDSSVPVTDEATSGGNPAPPAPAPAPPKSEPVKPVAPPEPEVKPESKIAPPVRVKTPEPEPEPEVKPKTPDPDDYTLTPKTVKPKVEKKYVLKAVSVKDRKPVKDTEAEEAEEAENARKEADAKARREADIKARNETRDAINRWSSKTSGGSLSQLQNNLSTSVKIEGPIGVGGGGAANNNWTSLVKKIYEDHFTPPEGGKTLITVVRVTVQRNGTVISDPIIQSSGDSEYDRAVNDALRQVRKLPKFPEGATEETRSLKIRFIPPSFRSLE